MKKIFLFIVLLVASGFVNAQTVSVEKSVYGVQTGFFGIWGHLETKLSNRILLRSELGVNSEIWGGNLYEKTGFLLIPVATVEPRWYYNLERRAKKLKRIDGNSGNFFSLKTTYIPDWFVISNYRQVGVVSTISLIPTWGLKRHIGKHFNYETGFGIGYRYYFAERAGYLRNESGVGGNIHLRIGYTF